MLVAALVGVDMRSTMDMDATMKRYPMTMETIQDAFRSILSVPVDDQVTIILKKTEAIRDEDEYSGFRLSLEAHLDNLKVPLKIDLTTGDQITPREVVYTFDLLLEDRSIDILAYNIETVIAEKIETIISRGTANTRMRDFYDAYILLKLQKDNITPHVLSKAVTATAEKRGSIDLLSEGSTIIDEIFSSDSLYKLWTRYQKQYSYAEDISWDEVKKSVFALWGMMDKTN